MSSGQTNDGTSSLTVDAAAKVFEGFLSPEDTSETEETPPTEPETAESTDVEEQPEQLDDDGESDAEKKDEESDDPEEEKQEEENTEPRVFKVKVDGEELEVPEDELVKGYSRTADYTRKTQQLADERKAFQSEAQAVREERQQYAASLTELAEAVKSLKPQEPDWDSLRQEDPAEFAAAWADWQQYEKRTKAIQDEHARSLQKVEQDRVRQQQEFVESEHARLIEAIPAWKDPKVADKEKSEIAEYAFELGFDADDLNEVRDHRVLLLLRKAKMFDKAEKTRPVAQRRIEEVKAATPGPRAGSRAPESKGVRASQKLAKSGSISDAAAVFEQLLDD